MAQSGDLGYTQGTETYTTTDPKTGKVVTDRGKWLTVRKKQADGSWKIVQDTGSSDLPLSSSAESDEAVLSAIIANENKIFETLERNHITAFGEMLPDDLIDVEDDGIHTKAAWLREFDEQKKTGLLFTGFKMDDLRLVRYGPSAATLVCRETVDGTQNGKSFQWHINSSATYVNRNGKWVPVLYQDTTAK